MPTTRTDQLLALLQDPELRDEAAKALKSAKAAASEVRALEQKLPKREKKAKMKTKKCKSKEAAAPIAKLEPAVAVKAPAKATASASASKAAAAKAKPAKKHRPVRKLIVLAVLGTIVALVASEDARKAALDALFGSEEEFQYTPQPAASSNGAS